MSTSNIKVGDFFTPDCPYANKCSGKGVKCQSCGHRKKDYYVPEYPYIWTTPKGTPSPTVTYFVTTSGTMNLDSKRVRR